MPRLIFFVFAHEVRGSSRLYRIRTRDSVFDATAINVVHRCCCVQSFAWLQHSEQEYLLISPQFVITVAHYVSGFLDHSTFYRGDEKKRT